MKVISAKKAKKITNILLNYACYKLGDCYS